MRHRPQPHSRYASPRLAASLHRIKLFTSRSRYRIVPCHIAAPVPHACSTPTCPVLQLWALDGVWSGATPQLLRAIRAFPASAKLPDSPVTALAMHEDGWPLFTAALGLANGQICIMRGDAGMRGSPCSCRSACGDIPPFRGTVVPCMVA